MNGRIWRDGRSGLGRPGRSVAGAALGALALAGSATAAPWSAPAVRSQVSLEASAPRIAINADGDAVAVWTRLEGRVRLVQASLRPEGGDWGPAQTISLPGADAYLPSVAIDSTGAAYAVWTRTTPTGLVVQAAVRATGASLFGPPQDISASQSQTAFPTVAVSPSGQAVAAWTGRVGNDLLIQVARRAPGDSVWSPPAGISQSGQNALEPVVAVDSAGTAAVVWRRYDGKFYRVQATLCPLGAACLAPQALSGPGRSAVSPRIGVDGTGVVHVLWRRFDGKTYRLQAIARVTSGAWTPVSTLSTLPSVQPALAVSAGGQVAATWRTYGRGERIQAAVRILTNGQWSAPADLTRAAPGARVRTPRIAIDPDGDAVVVWERSTPGNDRLESAVRAAGSTAFVPAELVASGGDIGDPDVALDATGAAYALFVQTSGAGRAVFSADRPAG